MNILVMDMMLQSALEGLSAVDLLTGVILLICMFLLRGQYEMHKRLASIEAHMEHTPTEAEMLEAVGKTRHQLRNEFTGVLAELDERLDKLEKGTA